ncbi:transmembrane protein [Mycolicibacterium fortuitum]|uniref:Transmembrane protein n=1 Tax=Mycolicibacterium fortuitum TaxID=1766 RepID=A0A378WCN1_MYCFO|nr:transmembrane protein [Mycolicibacterium fortuitum]
MSQSAGQYAQHQSWPAAAGSQQYPPPAEPIFQVTAMTHIGALIFWFNQRRTVTGTFDQCDAALRSAQTQNLLLGWWSFLSILIMNWNALALNMSARSKLKQEAEQAQAYAQWWHQHYGQTRSTRTQP